MLSKIEKIDKKILELQAEKAKLIEAEAKKAVLKAKKEKVAKVKKVTEQLTKKLDNAIKTEETKIESVNKKIDF